METIVIAGGSGLVGRTLQRLIDPKQYKVYVLTRNPKSPYELGWDYIRQKIDDRVKEAQHVINLTGAGIADSRWTDSRKELILESRIQSTHFLIQTFEQAKVKLETFISASAIGYYGDGGDKWLGEETPPVTKEFLSDVCIHWENAAHHATSVARHLSILRIGTVLSREGGALSKMDMTIPIGIANYFGNGQQYMSWIHADDLAKMMIFIANHRLSGIYNAVAPDVLTNKSFTQKLVSVMNPKAFTLAAPSFALRLALGEMSRVILNSSRVRSEKIQSVGFNFDYPLAGSALEALYQS